MKTFTALILSGSIAAMTAPAFLHAADNGNGAKVTYPSLTKAATSTGRESRLPT